MTEVRRRWTTIEAAQVLHISPETVRRHIQEGILKAEKKGKGWLIEPTGTPPSADGQPTEVHEQPTGFDGRPTEVVGTQLTLWESEALAFRTRVRDLEADLADVRGRLAAMTADRDELHDRVIRIEVERDAAVAERDRLWQMLSGTLGRLLPPAGDQVAQATTDRSEAISTGPTSRRWWELWRRSI